MFFAVPLLTRENLAKIRPKVPENAGSDWQGIKHSDLIEMIEKRVATQFKVKPEKLLMKAAAAGSELAATFVLPSKLGDLRRERPTITVLTSNNRRFATTYYPGVIMDAKSEVGMILGDPVYVHKHVKGRTTLDEVETALTEYGHFLPRMKIRIEFYKKKEISEVVADSVVMQTTRIKNAYFRTCPAYAGAAMLQYVRTWNGMYLERTAWSLMHAFGTQARRNPPMRQAPRLNAFRQIMDKELTPKSA